MGIWGLKSPKFLKAVADVLCMFDIPIPEVSVHLREVALPIPVVAKMT